MRSRVDQIISSPDNEALSVQLSSLNSELRQTALGLSDKIRVSPALHPSRGEGKGGKRRRADSFVRSVETRRRPRNANLPGVNQSVQGVVGEASWLAGRMAGGGKEVEGEGKGERGEVRTSLPDSVIRTGEKKIAKDLNRSKAQGMVSADPSFVSRRVQTTAHRQTGRDG